MEQAFAAPTVAGLLSIILQANKDRFDLDMIQLLLSQL